LSRPAALGSPRFFNVLGSDRLRSLLDTTVTEPSDWGGKRALQRLEADLTNRIVAVKGYEADCANAIEASGFAAAKKLRAHGRPKSIRCCAKFGSIVRERWRAC